MPSLADEGIFSATSPSFSETFDEIELSDFPSPPHHSATFVSQGSFYIPPTRSPVYTPPIRSPIRSGHVESDTRTATRTAEDFFHKPALQRAQVLYDAEEAAGGDSPEKPISRDRSGGQNGKTFGIANLLDVYTERKGKRDVEAQQCRDSERQDGEVIESGRMRKVMGKLGCIKALLIFVMLVGVFVGVSVGVGLWASRG